MGSTIVSAVLKSLMTEKGLKMVLGKLGDYLVASSKNDLDDKVWAEVKKTLKV